MPPPRLTQINHNTSEISIEDLIADESMVVTISHAGYIKRTPLTEYQAQRRGGKGKRGMSTRDEDFVEDLFIASTHSHILFFTSIGKVYKLKVHELPPGSRVTKGKALVNLLPLAPEERVKAVLPVPKFEPGSYVFTATRKGVVKKTDIMAYSRVLSVGIIALSLREGDELVDVRITSGSDLVMLASKTGQSVLFTERDVRSMGRVAAGVFGMRFREGDELVAMTVMPESLLEAESQLDESERPYLAVVTERGYGKRTHLSEYSVKNRGGIGVITIKTNDRNGQLVSARLVHSGDELVLITDAGQIIRTKIDGISVVSRNTMGVKLMTLDPDEKIVAVARVISEDDEDEEDALLAEEMVAQADLVIGEEE